MFPVIAKRVITPSLEERVDVWRGRLWRNLVESTARDMGDQARANIIKHGEPGGDWAPLSGFNAHKATGGKALKALRERAAGTSGFMGDGGHSSNLAAVLAANKAARARQKARKARGDAQSSLAHDGYARRKALGKTPGHGMFGPDVRLRDTGDMFAGLDGEVRYQADGAVVRLVSRGKRAGRPANNTLLRYHATGAGNLPVRNPGQNMELFNKRTAQRVRDFLEAARRSTETKEQAK